MIESRNPFRMQTSEQIDNEDTFLKLFGPEALALLPKEGLWDRVHIIRSSPGGGKTSILRLFTPSALLTLHAHRTNDEFKELYSGMRNLGAIGKGGPQVLGVMLSCSKGKYDSLDDLEFEDVRKRRLLFSLLDSRIILTALRGILDLKRLEHPTDLERISFETPQSLILPKGIPHRCTGKELYQWACNVEKAVYNVIDSFGPVNFESLTGHDTLVSASILKSEYISCDAEPVVPHVLIMLDDSHKLTYTQRSSLFSIIDQRPPVGVWIAERLEALTKEELLSQGGVSGRDVVYINLEELWRSSVKRFKKMTLSIADKRVQASNKVDIQSFSACLQDVQDTKWLDEIEHAIGAVSKRIKDEWGDTKKYQQWIMTRENFEGEPLERAVEWRSLEILIERDQKKNQKKISEFSPETEFQYDKNDLEERYDSAVKNAAELLLSHEFGFPYYFNDSRLVSIASSNIEQFIWFGANLFEEIISARLMNPNSRLSADRQEDIIKRTIKERWKQIPYDVKDGRDVMRFLEAIGKFALWETKKPNAPYAPGVTGIAILMEDREKLIQDNKKYNRLFSDMQDNKKYNRLSSILSECIAHNLLEPILDCKCQGKRWMILYLNRMLCVYFGLPLQYGGWRGKTLNELSEWIEKGFIQKKKRGKKT